MKWVKRNIAQQLTSIKTRHILGSYDYLYGYSLLVIAVTIVFLGIATVVLYTKT